MTSAVEFEFHADALPGLRYKARAATLGLGC